MYFPWSIGDPFPRIAGVSVMLLLACYSIGLGQSRRTESRRETIYVWPPSAAPGDTLQVFTTSSSESINLMIHRIDGRRLSMLTIDHVTQPHRSRDHEEDEEHRASLSPSCSVVIPPWWHAGVYEASFATAHDSQRCVFVVRDTIPGAVSRMAVVFALNTWQAYNNADGRSLYDFNSHGRASSSVLFRRPLASAWSSAYDQSYDRWDRPFVAWLTKQNMPAEYLMCTDLDVRPEVLRAYDVLVFVGHQEYWTLAERRAVEAFENAGKRVAIFGGNTCWWQARIEHGDSALVCYREARKDPLYHVRDSEVTCTWSADPVNRPENTFTGVSWANGGLVNSNALLPHEDGFGGYGAWNTHHWVYENTGLTDGAIFGYDDAIVGYEVDGAKFDWRDGIPCVSGVDSTPRSFEILALSPALLSGLEIGRNHATMGLFHTPSGGCVFNAATTNWVDGLERDTIVQTITRNVLRRFLTGAFPPQIATWSPYRVLTDSINHEWSEVRSRVVAARPGQIVPFAVEVHDPQNSKCSFLWRVDGVEVSHDSLFPWEATATDARRAHVITVHVNNAADTCMLEWRIHVASVRIVSQPSGAAHAPGERYTYRVDAAVCDHEPLQYALYSAPPWLSVSDGGFVSGIVGTDGVEYNATVEVRTSRGDLDTQHLTITVNQIAGEEREKENVPASPSITCHPNPFSTGTSATLELASGGFLTARICTLTGAAVRTLSTESRFNAGTTTLQWNGLNDSGTPVPDGAYFLVVLLQANAGSVITQETHLVVLQR
jgi:hypothetical protein